MFSSWKDTEWNYRRLGRQLSNAATTLILLLTVSIALSNYGDGGSEFWFKGFNVLYQLVIDIFYFLPGVIPRVLSFMVISIVVFFPTFLSLFILSRRLICYISYKWDQLVSQTKVYDKLHKHRMGYISSVFFLFDVMQISILLLMLVACYKRVYYRDSSLFIANASNWLLLHLPMLLLVFCMYSIFHPLKHHKISYIKSQFLGVFINELTMRGSTMSLPYDRSVEYDLFLLDTKEYLQCINEEKLTADNIKFVILENEHRVSNMSILIDQLYQIPHIIFFFIVKSSECIENNEYTFCSNIKTMKIRSPLEIGEFVSKSNRNKDALTFLLDESLLKYYYLLYKSPNFIYTKYRDILNYYSDRQAINGFFDLINFSLRIAVFIVADANNLSKEYVSDILHSISKMAKFLSNYEYFEINKKINVDWIFSSTKEIIAQKLSEVPEGDITIKELIMYTGYLRNSIKGHGFIKNSEVNSLYRLLFLLSLVILSKIDICSIEISNKNIIWSYKSETICSMKQYIFFNVDNEPFFLDNYKGRGKFVYINFFSGDKVIR